MSQQESTQQQLQHLIAERRLTPVFQPVVSLEGPQILGYEALIRGPENTALHTPAQIFAAARDTRLLAALEFACREVSCRRFMELELPGKLFLNMSPLSFTDGVCKADVIEEVLKEIGLDAERIVFELTERHPLKDADLLRAATVQLQKQGFGIALDDLGAGYSGLRVWSELSPDFVKLDRHFIFGIDQDPVKREFVRAILDIGFRTGNKVIAEGVESIEELNTLLALGIDHLQGFLVARPTTTPGRELNDKVRIWLQSAVPRSYDAFRHTVGDIAVACDTLSPDTNAGTVVKIFSDNPALNSMPVVEGDLPYGIVCRHELLAVFASRFAHELHAHKPIRSFISPQTIMVEYDRELRDVSKLVTEDPRQNLGIDFVVTARGRYRGVGKIRTLLRKVADDQLRSARHCNALTQLPGNVPLYEWVDRLLLIGKPFHVAYCDINNFKPFNDVFGYRRGDDAILLLAQILSESVDGRRDFVGHVGGDDFIVVFRSANWRECCHAILTRFARESGGLYPVGEDGSGSYWGSDRSGRRRRFDPLSLAIGAAQPDPERCRTHHDVALLLAEAKRSAKQRGGNILFESRRRVPSTKDLTA
ncbi:GGDEF domain-containing protein [Exilibacterium tricleocarpae]|uniref:GGDEF domain-containing protein n=1 Tax=Exilibacterium tricleocarpae TaxID=2591008 RepID=A0A545TAM4_9GAMM|nr:bifunctional diguanylate cyclase/phosphodiesterase [Exilibacterium tricleocarpae]TQV74273.1 GGDEF domain-containing protein [Exilibacterium tricleocarpae]